MKPKDVIAFFGSVAELCAAVGITHQAVYQWKKQNRVPELWQFKLEQSSKGKLKRDKK